MLAPGGLLIVVLGYLGWRQEQRQIGARDARLAVVKNHGAFGTTDFERGCLNASPAAFEVAHLSREATAANSCGRQPAEIENNES